MRDIRPDRLLGTIAGAFAALALACSDLGGVVARLTGSDLDAALGAVATLTLGVLALWLLGACLVIGLAQGRDEHARSARLARRVAPGWLVATLTVAAVGTAACSPAQAESRGSADLDGLRLPDRLGTAAVAPAPAPAPPPASVTAPGSPTPASSAPVSVVVAPGDSLWHLAAQHADAESSAAEIASLVRTWHELNRPVIGADPDLIHPGQVLAVPTPGEEAA